MVWGVSTPIGGSINSTYELWLSYSPIVLAKVDMVYLSRKDSALDVKQIIEMAESSARGRDGIIREVKF